MSPRLETVTDLSAGCCSITRTARGRFFWAAWWTGAPTRSPFRKPDSSGGGAKTRDEALAAAESASGRHLGVVEPYWAHAWNRMLRGEPPPSLPGATRPASAPRGQVQRPSAYSVLGLAPGATLEDVKRAYRRRVLESHPDRGGDAETLRAVVRAYERLVAKARGRR